MHAILQWGPLNPCRTPYCRILVHPYHFALRNIVNHQTGSISAPGLQLLVLQAGLRCRAEWLHLLSKLKLMAVKWRNCYNVLICFEYQGNGWHIFDSAVLIIMGKNIPFFSFSLGWILDKKAHIWLNRITTTPKVMTAVRTNNGDIYGKGMSSSCSYHAAE